MLRRVPDEPPTPASVPAVDPEIALPPNRVVNGAAADAVRPSSHLQRERRTRLSSLAEELADLRDLEPPAAVPGQTRADEFAPPKPRVVIDAPSDTLYAHAHPAFDRLAHVFHLEWHGIRAAAGYMPGTKVGIAGERKLSRAELDEATRILAGRPAICFHSFSPNMERVIRKARTELGDRVRLTAVWHGNTAQFNDDFERNCFERLVELREAGILDAVACVKPEMELLSPSLFPLTLLNLPPKLEAVTRRASPARAAFVPLPNHWRKNLYTNIYAVAGLENVDDVYASATFAPTPLFQMRARVVTIPRPNRDDVFRLLQRVDVVMNATLSECQPMTALEGLASSVPCITGPLSQGELDGHPYQRLVQVAAVDAIGQVREATRQVLELAERSPGELTAMMSDYAAVLKAEAFRRLGELVHG